MQDDFYTVRVDADLADMMPDYLRNRRKEVDALLGFVAAKDFDKMAQLAHRMIGVGTPYGFAHITNLAKIIRETALSQDLEIAGSLVKEYADYIKHVKVVLTK